MSEKYTKTQAAVTGQGSSLAKYQAVMVGKDGIGSMLYYELCTWFAYLPGALGLLLRKVFWPRLFLRCGHGVQFGYGIILRHPGRIALGNRVIFGEQCILDARNDGVEQAIEISDDVMFANAVSITTKGGTIKIGNNTGIGTQTVIQSTHESPTHIGADCIIGPQCYLVGGGNYHFERLDIPIREQGINPDSGCHLQDNVWLGGRVSVLGGVTIHRGSIAASGAVINKDVAENTIVGGVPAKTIRQRTQEDA